MLDPKSSRNSTLRWEKMIFVSSGRPLVSARSKLLMVLPSFCRTSALNSISKRLA